MMQKLTFEMRMKPKTNLASFFYGCMILFTEYKLCMHALHNQLVLFIPISNNQQVSVMNLSPFLPRRKWQHFHRILDSTVICLWSLQVISILIELFSDYRNVLPFMKSCPYPMLHSKVNNYLYYAWGKPVCDDHNKYNYKKLKVTELVLVYSALSEKSHFIYKLQSQSVSGNSRSLAEDFNVLLHYRGNRPTLEIKYLIFYSGKT